MHVDIRRPEANPQIILLAIGDAEDGGDNDVYALTWDDAWALFSMLARAMNEFGEDK